MSADQTRILAEIAELLHPLTDSILPDEEITLETNIVDDLGLASIGLAYLSGQIQSRYGSAANLVPLLTSRDPSSLTVGEIVRHVASVLGRAEDGLTAGSNGAANDVSAATQRPSAPGIHRARNDNAAVLSEYAPGTTRSVLRLPGGEVEVFMAGDGPALILMHPVNAGAGVFARQFASLATRYRLVCMHHPGVGATTWNTDITFGGIARLYRTVLAELSVAPPFHLMGSSFGGIVAQQFSLLYPAECASLVLVGCSYRGGVDSRGTRSLPDLVREEFDLMYGDGADQAPEGERAELEELLLRCESMDINMGLSYLNYFRSRPSLLAELPEIAVPALILRGRHDSMVTAKEAQVLYGAMPDAQFTELPNAGHFPYLTHPAEVGGVLTPFLEAHTGSAPSAPGTAAARPPASIRPPARCGIIISSGRCGSTLLSDLIAEDPETLSCYESLLPIQWRLTLAPLRELTGAEYWALLSEPLPHVLAQGILAEKEAAYPDDGRWANDKERLPPILFATLPKISANPDRLFDVLAARVPRFPSQPVGQHHRMLLDLVAHLEGRRRWVERTGGSSLVAHPWLATCPDANVVYLTRNIADTARSMSKHMSYRFNAVQFEFWVRCGTDPYSQRPEEWPDTTEMPEDLRRLMPDQLTVETLRDTEFDIGHYERLVAYMNGCTEQALADLKPQRLLRMQYEDLLADPVGELTRLGDFLGFADPSGWAARAADRVRG
ncbi:MAG TPA: alpha/beta fold hydrolase [Streptosporangiaceae bacterium]|nr:alpha/beta fold hydrolase [Streptosporangiaceae bacterium]